MKVNDPRPSAFDLRSDDGHRFEQVLLDAISDLGEGVVVTENGRCVWTNDAYCEMTGYSRDELMAFSSLIDLAPEDERQPLAERLLERFAGGEVQDHYEAGLVRKDGSQRRVEVAVKMVDQGGRHLVAIIRDVTERQQLENFKNLWAARVSHELKNTTMPLTGIVEVFASRFDELEDQTRRDMLAALQRQSQRLADLMDRMLDLARFEQGQVALRPQHVHVKAVVVNVIESLPRGAGRRIGVSVKDDLIAWVDPVRLDQMLTNLVGNALKYGGRSIMLEGAHREKTIVLSVRDDGEPIVEDSEQLFEAFTRGRNRSGKPGAGLGLAISRAYARASGGDLHFERTDLGNCFVIELPASRPEPDIG
jgi:PAS domain S-box-containing protein